MVLLVVLWLAAGARAADSVYWSDGAGISHAALNGSGGSDLSTSGATVSGPIGVALDPAAGRVYWANMEAQNISYANLDGSGGGNLNTTGAYVMNPRGVAIDGTAGKLYWANWSQDSISWAWLDGSGGGNLNTVGATLASPMGVAVDPAAGRIYWANHLDGKISYARLDGSGGGDLNTSGASVLYPAGVAIDPDAGIIYWANVEGDEISYARLDGSGGGNLATPGATVDSPTGVALDLAVGMIYWANDPPGGPYKISRANLNGSGGTDLNTTGATVTYASFPALLRAPVAAGVPSVSGGATPGSSLTCSQGSWAADVSSAFDFRAPRSFAYQWTRDDVDIAGATATKYTPTVPGLYTCSVTATNEAGSTEQTSNGVAIAAPQANSVYWANYAGSEISYANLDGSGGRDLLTAGATVKYPAGLAVDPVAGRIYWANFLGASISFANLDGSGGGDLNTTGASMSYPRGVAIDHAGGKIYWANYGGGISYAKLNGSGGGDLPIPGATANGPVGVAVDPGAGKIYWSNYNDNTISYAKLDGSGGGDLNTTGATVNYPEGVAIDLTGGKIYWANFRSGISYAKLDGSAGGDLATPGATVSGPVGVAIDPTAGSIYWANGLSNGISHARLDGSGGGDLSTTPASTDGPTYPALLRAPAGAGAPSVSGGSTLGSSLTCSQGSWAADVPAASYYRAPRSYAYQWTRYGANVTGATTATYTPTTVGAYACQVTASNQAGSATQTSAALSIAPSKPTVTITTPSNGAIYKQHQTIKAAYSCTAGAGVALSSCTGPVANGQPIETHTLGVHSFTVTATDDLGATTSATVTYTVSGKPLPLAVITRVHQSASKWRENDKLPQINTGKRPPAGTTFTFTLNTRAKVTFAFTQKATGRKVTGRCIATTKQNRTKPRCTRTRIVATLTFPARQGANTIRFGGRVSRTHKLPTGTYTLKITATNARGQRSAPTTLTFTIVT